MLLVVIFIIVIIVSSILIIWLFNGTYETQKQIDEKRTKHFDTEQMVKKSYDSNKNLWK